MIIREDYSGFLCVEDSGGAFREVDFLRDFRDYFLDGIMYVEMVGLNIGARRDQRYMTTVRYDGIEGIEEFSFD